MLKGVMARGVTVGRGLPGNVRISEAIPRDAKGLVIGTTADQSRENGITLRIEFGHETVQAAPVTSLKRSIISGEIDRRFRASHVNATLIVQGDCKAAIIQAAP